MPKRKSERYWRELKKARMKDSRTSDETDPAIQNSETSDCMPVMSHMPFMLHNFNPASVLKGELPVAALDKFSSLLGLIPPSFLYGATLAQDNLGHLEVDPNSRAVQLHILPGHYLVSCHEDGLITVYDSLPNPNRTAELLPQLKTLYNAVTTKQYPLSYITYVVPQSQGCTSDCGLFAAANAYLLTAGINPQQVKLDQNLLRTHLYDCLVQEKITPFPTRSTNIGESSIEKYFTYSMKLEQQRLIAKQDTYFTQSSQLSFNQSEKHSRAMYLQEWRSKNYHKTQLYRMKDRTRKLFNRTGRKESIKLQDRQKNRKQKSTTRQNRDEHQIQQDKEKDAKRKSTARRNRDEHQIQREKEKDSKRKSIACRNRDQQQLQQDKEKGKKQKSKARQNRHEQQLQQDKEKDTKRKSTARQNRDHYQLNQDKKQDTNRKSTSRQNRHEHKIQQDKEKDTKQKSRARQNRNEHQLQQDKEKDTNRKSTSRQNRHEHKIQQDKEKDTKQKSRARQNRSEHQLQQDKEKDTNRKSTSRQNRHEHKIQQDKEKDTKQKSRARQNRSEHQLQQDQEKDTNRKSTSRQNRHEHKIQQDKEKDTKQKSRARQNRSEHQLQQDKEKDTNRKSTSRQNRHEHKIQQDKEKDTKQKSRARQNRSEHQLQQDKEKDTNRKSTSRQNRHEHKIQQDKEKDTKQKSRARQNRSEHQLQQDKEKDTNRKSTSRQNRHEHKIQQDKEKDTKRKSTAHQNKDQQQLQHHKEQDKNRKSRNRSNRDESELQNERLRDLQRWHIRQKQHFSTTDENKRYQNFKSEILYGPIFPCNVCHRIFTKTGVLQITKTYISKVNFHSSGLYESAVQEDVFLHGKQYVCHSCNRWLMIKHKLPPMSVRNGLTIEDLPIELNLSELGNVLIAKNIIFLKLFKLPKSRWSALKDKIVNVPITDDDILRTLSQLTSLPRLPDHAGLIAVQLKRKVSYKSAVKEAYIDPQNLLHAVTKLKQLGHPGYVSIDLTQDYLQKFRDFVEDDDEAGSVENSHSQLNENNSNDQNTPEVESNYNIDNSQPTITANAEDDKNIEDERDTIRKFQYNIQSATVMSNNYPEITIMEQNTTVQENTDTESCSIAPGEGKIPSNLMRDTHWDVNAFPCFHPSGKFGLAHPRQQKLTPQQYFNQRLQNVNNRFASSPPYVFAAQYYLERCQIEQNINISYLKGKVSGENLLQIDDGFTVLDKIPGTPKYWLNKRYELIAKLENLGAFNFFFTLSMADMRWPEVITSILSLQGRDVAYSFDDNSREVTAITVDGEPLEDFIERESMHELVRQNVLTATRCFDQRVKAFIKNIIKGKNSPLCVQYFNYRVEFQLRGAGHIHGVLWINLQQMEKAIPGIQSTFTALRLHQHLSDKQCQLLSHFVDRFTSCTLSNTNVSHIVKDVQIHRHSHSCRKYGTGCRFFYPKLPSERTIIAQPLSKDDFRTEQEYKTAVNNHTSVINAVRKVLQDLEEHKLSQYQISDVLKLAEVNQSDYYKALAVSAVGTTIVMKRNVDEIYVNNYNTEWIRAWNGNMDLQVCLDYHAVITYITDYYSKDESGTMEFLRKAAKENCNKDRTEVMRLLSQVFLTHRQNGECEAYYKIFPSLHLTESNIKSVFVATNFPHDRYKFLVKVSESGTLPDPPDVDDFEVNHSVDQENGSLDTGSLIKVAGKDGKYAAKTSIHDKYKGRPAALENMCLAQFATLYELSGTYLTKSVSFVNDIYGESSHTLVSNESIDYILPKYIRLSDGTSMKLRSYPAVLRQHKFRVDTQFHEFLFSELLLYSPWRSEESLYFDNFHNCLKIYESKKAAIISVKEILFPHMNIVQESQALLEAATDNRSRHIGDVINPQHEQDQDDQAVIGIEEDENYAIRDPGELRDVDLSAYTTTQKTVYSRIDISDYESMLKKAQQLDSHQKQVFDTVIKYCKDLRKSSNKSTTPPTAPLLMTHGGAGSGKSTLINIITVWAEYLLRTSDNRHPDHPLIIRTAPTGTAASNISGLTMHASFNLRFGNDFRSLSDKQRDTQRTLLSHLQILIIDEVSMMKADMLYQINLRLQEIKQNKNDFGGISILLFGDLMQLQPVRARWIFEEPYNPAFAASFSARSLWHLFQTIELKTNHRQGDNHTYAELLNRVRYGTHTNEDVQLLITRVTTEFPSDAIHLFGKNKDVNEFNNNKLSKLPGEEYTVIAQNIHPVRSNYQPNISKDGSINDTPFLHQLKVKEGARIMLIYNVDTSDGLTNGARGQIQKIVTKEDSQVKELLIKFDNPKVGKQMRASKKVSNSTSGLTPISRVAYSYSLGKLKKDHAASAKVIQFPIKLAWAATVHKFQGQTIYEPTILVGHMETIFAAAQAYVLFGRVQSLSQLLLTQLPEKMIKVNLPALEESARLSTIAINNKESLWKKGDCGHFRIAAFNTRSLSKHLPDIKSDPVLLQSDFLCISETWIKSSSNTLDDFSCYLCGSGKGKGVALFAREIYKPLSVVKYDKRDFQILHVQFDLIHISIVYISPGTSSVATVAEYLKNILTSDKISVICGDFNIDFKKLPDNIISKTLHDSEYQQVISEPTHLAGSLLDHLYVNKEPIEQFIHPAYFSDHDATCVIMNRQ